jgi:hypothetical protein
MSLATDSVATLRDRLLVLRDDVLRQLAEADYLDSGLLGLLGNVGAALATLDTAPADVEAAERAVVVDDGNSIALVVYRGASAVASVTLSPQRAVGIAVDLGSAARRQL